MDPPALPPRQPTCNTGIKHNGAFRILQRRAHYRLMEQHKANNECWRSHSQQRCSQVFVALLPCDSRCLFPIAHDFVYALPWLGKRLGTRSWALRRTQESPGDLLHTEVTPACGAVCAVCAVRLRLLIPQIWQWLLCRTPRHWPKSHTCGL